MFSFALFGRPNVGKSTLFNRLTKTRNALVADVSGVTRDRQYSVVDACYRIIDTGGILLDAAENQNRQSHYDPHYLAAISDQAYQALAEADAILLVMDAQAGVSLLDVHLVSIVRRMNKPCFLIVNKIDGVESWQEFYQFGLTVHPVAAVSRRGVHKLHRALSQAAFADQRADDPLASPIVDQTVAEPPVTVTLVGKPNVGKSTLTNCLLGFQRMLTSDRSGTTIDAVGTLLERYAKHYFLVDTAGLRRRVGSDIVEKFSHNKTRDAMTTTDVVLLLFDAQSGVTEQDIRLLRRIIALGKPFVLVVNKWDALNQRTKHQFSITLERKLQASVFFTICYISALRGEGVENIFEALVAAQDAHGTLLAKRPLQQLIDRLVAQHPPSLVSNKRIKVKYVRQISCHPPTIALFGNQLLRYLQDSYARYLVNAIRQFFALIGTPLRLQLQWEDNPYHKSRNTKKITHKKVFIC